MSRVVSRHLVNPNSFHSKFDRFRVIGLIFVLANLAVVARLFYWQVYNRDNLVQAAYRQHWSQQTVEAPRGLIKSSDGTIIAGSQAAYNLFWDRKQADDYNPTMLISQISSYTAREPLPPHLAWRELDVATDEANLDSPSDATSPHDAETLRLTRVIASSQGSWIPLSTHVTQDAKDRLELEKIPGLVFLPKTIRSYPDASQFSHVLGFVGQTDAGQPQGYFGLEGYYNRELAGQSGRLSQETDARGNPIAIGESKTVRPIQGRSLTTHLDRTLQYIVEKELATGIETYQAASGTVTVMDPKTGAILAMASLPKYQPKWYQEFPGEAYSNPVVGQSYEPGSIFKPLVVAAAIDAGVVDDSTICPCPGPERIGPDVVSNWDNRYNGASTITDIITNSDNIGMIFIGRRLGQTELVSYLRDFGFGAKTNIDLQEEMTQQLRADNQWREIDLATATFGQGIAVTPIQMVAAMGAIANNGLLMQPQIVKQLEDNGQIIPIEPVPVRQVISSDSAAKMKQIMTTAFQFFITNFGRRDLDGFRIAGKTGTAQIPIRGHYDDEKVIASFIGFAPADDPKFVMLVTLREPTQGNFASQNAAPLWFNIAKQLFAYWGVQPQE